MEQLLADDDWIDAAEDVADGPDRRRDELPAELTRRTDRLAVIRKAKAASGAEHAAAAQQAAAERGEDPEQVSRCG